MMDHVKALIQRHFTASTDELNIGGIPVTSLAAEFGTPLYVYDSATIDRKLKLVRESFPPEFAIYYSVKANPNLVILKHFVSAGCGLEIASAGEFARALEAGCRAREILFAGPGKTEAELEFVLKREIGEIHVESLLEAKRISSICRRLAVRARVALRVNPSGEAQGGAMRMGGKPAPFGVDEENLDGVLEYILQDPHVEFRGIHLYSGTQILDHSVLRNQYLKGLEIGRRVVARLKKPLHTIDFGGGLGIPYFANEHELDMGRLRATLAEIFATVPAEECFTGTQFIVEPGRYLVGEAGVYVARVNDIKTSRGKKFLILDGGMNHHLAASGNLGQVIKRNFPIAVINRLNQTSHEVADLVGPLCTPLDTLGRDVEISMAKVGDLVGIFQSGAYALSASPIGFLSHASPSEVFVKDKQATLCNTSKESFPRLSHSMTRSTEQ